MTMTSTEAALLCRYVAACCPAQKFDEFTPDAWHDLLGDLPFDLAKRAAAEVAKRQPFVSPSEIRDALRRMRAATHAALKHHPAMLAMNASAWDPEGELDYQEWRDARMAKAGRVADDAIRGGATFGGVDLFRDDPEIWSHAPEATLAPEWLPELPAAT